MWDGQIPLDTIGLADKTIMCASLLPVAYIQTYNVAQCVLHRALSGALMRFVRGRLNQVLLPEAADLDALRAKLTPAVRELLMGGCYIGENEGGKEAFAKFARHCLPAMRSLHTLE